MSTLILLACLALWYASGVWGFIYMCTRKFDFTTRDLPMAISTGFLGPFVLLAGLMLYLTELNRVIVKKRSGQHD